MCGESGFPSRREVPGEVSEEAPGEAPGLCGEVPGKATGQAPGEVPDLGTFLVDTGREDRVGEFRGTAGPYWSLRPVRGGTEWEAPPAALRPATPIERLRAENARCNARSRGEVL